MSFQPTGATNHITQDSSTLGNTIPYSGFNGIVVGNGDSLSILSYGIVSIPTSHSSLYLTNVLHAPTVTTNPLQLINYVKIKMSMFNFIILLC